MKTEHHVIRHRALVSKLQALDPIHHTRDELCSVLHHKTNRDELLERLQLYHGDRATKAAA